MKLEEQLVSNVLIEGRAFDATRWNGATYPPVASLSESAFFEVSKLILCSNGQRHSYDEGVKELVENSLYGLKSDKRIVMGFRMRLEAMPCSAALLRIKLHEHFRERLWPVIKRRINFATEEREIIFVGYENGGALASLAAWMAIKQFEMLKPADVIINNGNNQVKVITWDELPLFTRKTASKSPVLPRNHFRFNSVMSAESIYRQIAQSSGGVDEINYFGTSGDVIPIKSVDYADYMSRLSEINNTGQNSATSAIKWDPISNLLLFLKEKKLRDLTQERKEKLLDLLSLHAKHLTILFNVISNNYRAYLADELLAEPNSCASALASQLSNSIFSGSQVACRVDDFNVTKGTFQVLCSYQTSGASKSLSQFITFDAVLGDSEANRMEKNCLPFMEEVEILPDAEEAAVDNAKSKGKKNKKKDKKNSETATPVKALRYTGPAPLSYSWSNCIYDLFEQQPHLSLISPYAVNKDVIYPRCSYTPFDPSNTFISANSRNTGCYLRAPKISRELLQVYTSDPTFFYRSVDPAIMKFPKRCVKVLFHIPFKANERAGLESLQQVAVDYMTQLVTKNPIADSDVTLWRQRDTEAFKTLAFLGTESISAKDLADRSHYEDDFENSIIKCLSNPAYPYRDCTDPQNRWVPMACPAACYKTHGAINFLCKQVKSCPLAAYYISVSTEGTLEQVKDVHTRLIHQPNPQFGIFHVQTRGRSQLSYYGSSTFNVALFRIPSP